MSWLWENQSFYLKRSFEKAWTIVQEDMKLKIK